MRGLILAAVCLLGMAGAMTANPAGLADLVRGKGYDLLQTVSPRPTPETTAPGRPLLIGFDSASDTPNWIDLAVLVRRLDAAGAKAVILPEPLDRPDPMSPEQVAAAWMDAGLGLELRDSLVQLTPHQKILADAFSGKPVIGVFDTAATPAAAISDAALTITVTNGLSDRLPASPGARGNLADVERAMSGLGDAALRPDTDNVVRSVPLATDVAGTPVASVLLRAVGMAKGGTKFTLDERAVPDLPLKLPDLKQSLVFRAGDGGPVIPADAKGRYRLYKARPDDLPRISAEAVLAGRARPELIRGRIAIVDGIPISAPLFDVGGGERWSRAEILTNALDQVAAGQHVQRLSWADTGEAVAMVMAGAVILALAALPGTALMVLFALIAIVGMWTGALYGLSEYGLWFDAALPTSGLLVTALLALMFRPAGARKEKSDETQVRDRREPGLPLIVPALRRPQPEGIQGSEATVLFCGIRNVEKLEQAYQDDPESLDRLFKAFRNMAASHIESQGGTVLPEPAVGAPGMVAGFWRMPKERSPAARPAADCALRLVAGLDDFNASLEDAVAAGPDAPEPPELDVSVGIATGPVFMQAGGPGGVPERIFGTAISVAERLEQSAADYGPAIVMGGKAADGLRNRYALLEIDLLALPWSGFEETQVFALLGNPLVRANPRFRTLDEAHRAIFLAYRECKWPMAKALVDQCRKLSMAVPGLYDLYDRRIAWFEQNPPEEGWTGAFTPPVR